MLRYLYAAFLLTLYAALVTASAIVDADTTFPAPDKNRDRRFESVEYFGYLMAETNPGGNTRRALILTKSEFRKFDPVASLAFAENDAATYDECIALLEKPVKVMGVEIDRGGAKWVLVESVRKLH